MTLVDEFEDRQRLRQRRARLPWPVVQQRRDGPHRIELQDIAIPEHVEVVQLEDAGALSRVALLAAHARHPHGKGLEQGTDGYELLQTWLKKKPDSELFVAWEAYIKALTGQLNEEQNRLLKNQIVGFAKMVAAAAGGILGFGKVSGDEEKVLNKIEAAFPS